MKKLKLNVIDIIVIVIIAAAIVFAAVRILGPEKSSAGARTITYEVVVPAVPVEVYESIAAVLPGQMMSNGSMQEATVESVRAEPCAVSSIEFEDSANSGVRLEIPAEGNFVKLIFTCTASPESAVTNKLGSQEIRIGKEHIVKTTHFEVTGYVSAVSENG